MSDGCRHELYHRRYRSGTWAEWQAVARVLCPGLLEVASEPAPRKVAPPWQPDPLSEDGWMRGEVAFVFRDGSYDCAWRIAGTGYRGRALTPENAKATADAMLARDGWTLEAGPPRKVAPPWAPDSRISGYMARRGAADVIRYGGTIGCDWRAGDADGTCLTIADAMAAADAALTAAGWELS